jgi:protocatechuate 3,4-dioxygenase alpha subunit
MAQPLDQLPETPSQTAGPYVHIGCTPNFAGIGGIYDEDLGARPFPDDAQGDWITITGQVIDGTGTPLRDVMLESWQAGPDGAYGPGARGFCRFAAAQDSGEWTLRTLMPGAAGGAPHIALWIVARGINIGLQTRIYFEGHGDHDTDPVLRRIEHRNRVATLIAKPDGAGGWRHDIRLQGDGETVFLDV